MKLEISPRSKSGIAVRYFHSLLLGCGMLFLSTMAFGQIGISITVAPPDLPVYDQPICPGDGYIWTPGYWAWADGDYYWVPGTWVLPPESGFLWTPGYWGWGSGGYVFDEGYWGPTVGFYGGINYGFGYFGHGYEGGRWTGGHFFYNRTVNNINVSVVHNVYDQRLYAPPSHVGYNGGTGGINLRATAQENAAARGRHDPPVAAQTQHVQAAHNEPQQRFSANHGAPAIAATPQPAALKGSAVVAAKPAPARSATPFHPSELPAAQAQASPSTGNPKLDQKYQQQQKHLAATQDQDRQKLQQKQDVQHQQLARQNAAPPKTQQLEQQHQQQTQQLQQRHTQQTQQMQQRQQPQQRPQPQQKQQPPAARGGGGRP